MVHMAVGTSLGCIVFTGISSAYAHRQKNAINYKFFKPIALGIVIGAFLGALFAVRTANKAPRNAPITIPKAIGLKNL